MRISKALILFIFMAHASALISAASARAGTVPMVTADATQPFMNPEDNFETVLAGDQTSLFSGQFLNAFTAPNSVDVSFNNLTDTTLISFAGQGIATNPTAFDTFGFALQASVAVGGIQNVNPEIVDEYWTSGGTIEGHVPEQNLSSQYSPTTRQATITVSNDPLDTFSLSGVGYLVTNTPYSLSQLNRSTLPPSAFLSSGVPNGTTLTPGGSTSFNIAGVLPGQYVTVFADAQFSGSSSTNPYTGVSGRWFEFQAVPEPSSCVLLTIGAASILGCAARRSRASRGGNPRSRVGNGLGRRDQGSKQSLKR